MKVFFTTSRHGQKYRVHYDFVRETIKQFTVELISPEEKNYHLMLTGEERRKFPTYEALRDNWFWHYEAIRRGIHWADAVIIEISAEDFQLGHEATLAIMEKKPVLCLSVHEDFSKKITNPYFFGGMYKKETVKGIIQDFFARVRELRHAKRFNMFLYPSQLTYLEQESKNAGMNVSEYIRKLINTDRRVSYAQ